jgi:hypothetical protein
VGKEVVSAECVSDECNKRGWKINSLAHQQEEEEEEDAAPADGVCCLIMKGINE